MNKKGYTLFAGLVASAFTLPANAELDKAGLSGELSLLLGVSNQESNFNTDDKKIDSLNQSGDSETDFLPLPLAELRYTFGARNQHQVFAGTSRADIGIGNFILEAGYAYEVAPYSRIEISYLPDLIQNETFSDPFVVGESRDKIDTSGHALRFKYLAIAGSKFSLDTAYYSHRLDSEKSGSTLLLASEQKMLNREGEGLYSKLSYLWQLAPSTRLVPSLIYQSFDADGKAMSHDAFGLETSLIHKQNQHTFALTGAYLYSDYDKENPIFNKSLEADKYKVFLAYEYDKLLGWDNWVLSMLAGYTQTNANINFYDQTSLITGVGVSYKF